MAIDNAEKRRSVTGIITGYLSVGVTPNASKDVEWRQQSGHGYSGILPSGAVVAADGFWLVRHRRRGRR